MAKTTPEIAAELLAESGFAGLVTPPPPTPPVLERPTWMTGLIVQDGEPVTTVWKHGKNGHTVRLRNPTTGQISKPVATGELSDVELALSLACASGPVPGWAHKMTCCTRDQSSRLCCYPVAAPTTLDESKYERDVDLGPIHFKLNGAKAQEYWMSTTGVVIDHAGLAAPAKIQSEVGFQFALMAAERTAPSVQNTVVNHIDGRPPPSVPFVSIATADACGHAEARPTVPPQIGPTTVRTAGGAFRVYDGLRHAPTLKPVSDAPGDPRVHVQSGEGVPCVDQPPSHPALPTVRSPTADDAKRTGPGPIPPPRSPSDTEPPGTPHPPTPVPPGIVLPAVPRQTMRLPYFVPDHVVRFGLQHGVTIVSTNQERHPHIMALVEKNLVLHRMYRIAPNGIAVGMSAAREHRRGRPWRCMEFYTPLHQRTRHAMSCLDQFDDCKCDPRAPPVVAYRPDLDITTIARFAVGNGSHKFYVADVRLEEAHCPLWVPKYTDDERAMFLPDAPEATMSCNADGVVTLQFVQDPHSYRYPAPAWQGQCGLSTDVGVFAISRLASIGHSSVWSFELSTTLTVSNAVREFTAAVVDSRYTGPVRFSPSLDSKPDTMVLRDIKSCRVFSCGPDLVVNMGQKEVYLSKTVLSSAAMTLVGLPRNEQTTAGLRTTLIDQLARCNLTPPQRYATLQVALPLCVAMGVADEITAWDQTVSSAHDSIRQLNERLGFTMPSLSQLLTGPSAMSCSRRVRATATRVGSFIAQHSGASVLIALALTAAIATFALMVMGPGDEPPPTVTTHIQNWLLGVQETVHQAGSSAYAYAFPECSSVFLRRLGFIGRCRAEVDGHLTVIETWRYAAYLQFALYFGTALVGVGVILCEELFKRTSLGMPIVLTWDCAVRVAHFGFSGMMWNLAAVPAHIFLTWLPLSWAIIVHMLWNGATYATLGHHPMLLYMGVPACVCAYALLQRTWPTGFFATIPFGTVFGPSYVAERNDPVIDPTGSYSGPTVPKTRREPAFTNMGPIVLGELPNVAAAHSDNLRSALLNRFLYPKNVVQALPGEIRRMLTKLRPLLRAGGLIPRVVPLEFLKWLVHYTPSQRKMLLAGRERLRQLGYQRKWAIGHRVFRKREKICKRGGKFAPRLVLTVTPMFSCVVGPFLYAASKALKKAWSGIKCLQYVPGRTVEDVSACVKLFMSYGFICWSLDDSKADSSYDPQTLRETDPFYAWMSCPRDAYECISDSHGMIKCYAPDGQRASVLGGMPTGSNETTIGNTTKLTLFDVLSMYCWLLLKRPTWLPWFFATLAGLLPPQSMMFVIFKAGDDCLFLIHPECDYDPHYRTIFGFRPEGRTGPMWDMDFLSGLFWPCGDVWVLAAKPGRQLAKLGVDIDCSPDGRAKMRGVALGMIQQCNHVPVLGAVLRRILFLTRGVKATPTWEEWKPRAQTMHRAHSNTYLFAAMRYGVSPSDLLACEARIARWQLNELVSDPIVLRMCARDI